MGPELMKPIEKEELKYLKFKISDSWYGGTFHHRINIVFSQEEESTEEHDRLNQLKNFFQLALDHIHDIIPSEGEFVLNGDTWEMQETLGINPNIQKTLVLIRDVYNAVQFNPEIQNNAVSLFQRLGDKGVKFNEAEKILNLLTDKNIQDIGKVKVTIENVPDKNNNVLVINSGPLFLWPDQRLNELTEELRCRLKKALTDEIQTTESEELSSSDLVDIFEILLHDCDWIKFDQIDEVMKEANGMGFRGQ